MSIAWGPWSGTGLAAESVNLEYLRRRGIEAITPQIGQRLWQAAMADPRAHWILFKGLPHAEQEPVLVTAKPATQVDQHTDPHDPERMQARLASWLQRQFAAALEMPLERVRSRVNFQELGLDSMLAIRFVRRLERELDVALDATLPFTYPSIEELAQWLAREEPAASERVLLSAQPDKDGPQAASLAAPLPPNTETSAATQPRVVASREIERDQAKPSKQFAVVGMACRFPGASDPEAFWHLVAAGRDAIGPLPETRRRLWPLLEESAAGRAQVGGFLANIEQFDPEFFGLSLREARRMDPQQRLLLEVAWEALERTGYRPDRLAGGRCGVFVGGAASEYLHLMLASGQHLDPHTGSGNSLAMLANRLSYAFDWRGPSVALDTACSSSLAALHLACRSLAQGECDAALVGGVNLILSPGGTLVCDQAGMMSTDGRSKTFDARADGYVRSEGVGVVIVKPWDAALRDGDDVWGVIRATAMNQDGHSKVGLTAPNPKAQRDVLRAAYDRAGIDPETVGLWEAHGTGTSLGDPIELRAASEAVAGHTDRRAFCAIGSVKSNIGHLEAAAGIAGLMKALLALRHATLPATLHIERPNDHIRFESTPFYLNERPRVWPASARHRRRAGVSSFGFGGTNVHAVLEEAPTAPRMATAETAWQLLTLSARDEESLRELARRYVAWLEQNSHLNWTDVCWTAWTGRVSLDWRVSIVAKNMEQALDRLRLFVAANGTHSLAAAGVFAGTVRDDETVAANFDEALAETLTEATRLPGSAQQWLGRWCQGEGFAERILPHLLVDRPTTDTPLDESTRGRLLAVVGRLHALGVRIAEEGLFDLRERRRVLLPTAVFRRAACWLELPATETLRPGQPAEQPNQPSHQPEDAIDALLHECRWEERSREACTNPLALTPGRVWLVFHEHDALGHELVARLRQAAQRVIEVVRGPRFRRAGDEQFALNPDRPEEYARLVKEVWSSCLPSGVLHLWPTSSAGMETPEEFNASLTDGVRSLFHLWQALAPQALVEPFDLRVVTRGCQTVRGVSDCRTPTSAATWGLLRALSREQHVLRCQLIELSDATGYTTSEEAAWLVEELRVESPVAEVALAQAKRWQRTLAPLDRRRERRQSSPLRSAGVYVITGGCGGIGLAVARHLAERYAAKLVLVGRTPLVDAGGTKIAVADDDDRAPLARERLAQIAQLHSAGAEVAIAAADVSDEIALAGVLRATVEQFGRIDAVLHAAGTIRNGLLKNKSSEEFEATLLPKVQGAWVLDRVLREHGAVPLVLFSSLSGWEGNIFQADYSAANRWLDSFAAWRTAQGRPTLSIDWSMWGEVGMAVSQRAAAGATHRLDVRSNEAGHSAAGAPLATREALAALEACLQLDRTQVVVAARSIDASDTSPGRPTTEALSPAEKATGQRRADWIPTLIEWLAATLEITVDRIDPRRPFLEMGVDSVIAAEMARRINQYTKSQLPRTLLFDHPTIERLARALEERYDVRWSSEQSVAPTESSTLEPGLPATQLPCSSRYAVDGNRTLVEPVQTESQAVEPIAVIGMGDASSGRRLGGI